MWGHWSDYLACLAVLSADFKVRTVKLSVKATPTENYETSLDSANKLAPLSYYWIKPKIALTDHIEMQFEKYCADAAQLFPGPLNPFSTFLCWNKSRRTH